MKNNDSEKARRPVLSLLMGDELTAAQKTLIWTGIILTGCAIGVFIWLIVRAGENGSSRGIVMASSFILFAVGFLYFSLARLNNPRRAWIFLYITVPIAVGAFVVSLFLQGGASAPAREYREAERQQQLYEASEISSDTVDLR